MTQGELEQVAREMRARGLHSSWEELLAFSKDVVGNLVDAYQAFLRSMTLSNSTSSNNRINMQKIARNKMAGALAKLTSEAQVARWESQALAEGHVPKITGTVEDK